VLDISGVSRVSSRIIPRRRKLRASAGSARLPRISRPIGGGRIATPRVGRGHRSGVQRHCHAWRARRVGGSAPGQGGISRCAV